MAETDFEVRSVDLRTAGDELQAALSRFADRLCEERYPEDPPIPHEERVAGRRNRPDYHEMETWIAFDPSGRVAATANASYTKDVPVNQHLLHFHIEVRPESRRRGLGRVLLERVVDMATRTNRHLLMTQTTERVPAGEAFLDACGAQKGLEGHGNQLILAELDRGLLRRWISRAPQAQFELGVWEDAYPDDQLPAVAELWRIMNDAPRGRLDIEDFHVTPDHLRQLERTLSAVGTHRRTLYARDRATGRFAGFTEVYWNPNRPQLLGQGFTGVLPEFRRQGLGRWLKAEMLEQVLRVYPQVGKVRTGNADMNEPMMSINRELGYKPYIAGTIWQLEVARAQEFLGSRS